MGEGVAQIAEGADRATGASSDVTAHQPAHRSTRARSAHRGTLSARWLRTCAG